MRKLMLGLTPLIAVAALMVAPSMASAQPTRAYGTCGAGTPTEPPCPAGSGEEFTAFPNGVPIEVVSQKAVGSGAFVLENEESKAGIECTTFSDKGTFENVGGIGKSKVELTFDDCVPLEDLGIGCTEINPKTNHEITGEVTDEVTANGEEVGIEIAKGTQFDIICVIAGEEANLKGVKGAVVGKVEGNKLVFEKAEGLKFLGASNITGSDETFEKASKKPVYVN